MSCFEPFVSLETMQNNKELARQICNSWDAQMVKLALTWGLMGGMLGLSILKFFMLRPAREHYDLIPSILGVPGGYSGPKTVAERSAGLYGWIMGSIISVVGAVLILPGMQTEMIVVKGLSLRITLGIVAAFITTTPILLISLRTIDRMIGGRY
ncbi:MAG: hypothetical protein NTY04_03460 [Candidatus Staskawiczbacteria bacterium]|nr:hypothetical protein [Candidatus Staskawiczbacteria bacterium]